MQSLTQNPHALLLAVVFGMIPSLLWLFFWLREDREHPEPRGLLFFTFAAGMLAVLFVLPLERFIGTWGLSSPHETIAWATAEELLKFAAFFVIMWHSPELDEPLDYPIYCITAALGFAALENALFIIHPVVAHDTLVSFLTSNMRFLGSTLLHSATGALVGIGLGLSYFKTPLTQKFYGLMGFFAAVALHATFNFFIIKDSGENFLQVFGFLWVITIIIMLLFEKLRRMSSYVEDTVPTTTYHG